MLIDRGLFRESYQGQPANGKFNQETVDSIGSIFHFKRNNAKTNDTGLLNLFENLKWVHYAGLYGYST